jgi:hypothetical protein
MTPHLLRRANAAKLCDMYTVAVDMRIVIGIMRT